MVQSAFWNINTLLSSPELRTGTWFYTGLLKLGSGARPPSAAGSFYFLCSVDFLVLFREKIGGFLYF